MVWEEKEEGGEAEISSHGPQDSQGEGSRTSV